MSDLKLPELVDRVCACGCGKMWRCTVNSKCIYWALWHDPHREYKPMSHELDPSWVRHRTPHDRANARALVRNFADSGTAWGFYVKNRAKGFKKSK